MLSAGFFPFLGNFKSSFSTAFDLPAVCVGCLISEGNSGDLSDPAQPHSARLRNDKLFSATEFVALRPAPLTFCFCCVCFLQSLQIPSDIVGKHLRWRKTKLLLN